MPATSPAVEFLLRAWRYAYRLPFRAWHVCVHLPVVSPDTEAGPESDLAPPRGTERILFVDDEKVLVEMAEAMLGGLGYRVTAAADSRKALDLVLGDPDGFDLVITDITMPGMTKGAMARKPSTSAKRISLRTTM